MNPHHERGVLLFGRERHEEAVAEFQEAIAIENDNPYSHGLLALALSRLDRHQQALEAARRAIEVAPAVDYGHYVLARVFTDRSRLGEALESIKTAISLEPADADNHGLLARIEFERENWEAAKIAAETGLESDAESDICLHFRALALAKLGRHKEAEMDQEKLLATDPNDPYTHAARGWTLLEQGESGRAKEHFLESLRIDPTSENARFGLANALKAQHYVFGITLRFLLYLDRFRTWVIWLFMLGFLVGLRQLDRLGTAHPDLMICILLIKALFWSLLILIVVAHPLFDLVLRLYPDGRKVMSPDQLRASNWHAACLALALAMGLSWAWNGGILMQALALPTLMLTYAITNTFQSSPGWVRSRMKCVTVLAAILIPLSYATLVLSVVLLIKLKINTAWMMKTSLIHLPLFSTLLSAFSDNIAAYLERRRPDSPARIQPS